VAKVMGIGRAIHKGNLRSCPEADERLLPSRFMESLFRFFMHWDPEMSAPKQAGARPTVCANYRRVCPTRKTQ